MHKNDSAESSIKNASNLKARRKNNDDLIQSVELENKQIQEGEELVLNIEMLEAHSEETQLKFNIKGAIELTDDIGNLTFTNGVVANANGTITVPTGVTSFQVRINTLNDTVYERSENVVVKIGQHKIKAQLKDAVSVEEIIVVNEQGKAIEGEALTFNVLLNNSANNSVTMKLDLKGLATKGDSKDVSDLVFSNGVTQNNDGTITIPAGVTSFDVVVSTLHDGEFERKENIKLKLGGMSASAKIIDALEVEDISVANAKGKAFEGENLVFDISLNNSSSEDVTMKLNLKGKSITGDNSDFAELQFTNGVVDNQDGTITIPAGVNSFQIIAPTLFDGIKEKAESLTISLANKKATGKIVDSEEQEPPSVTSVEIQNGEGVVVEGETLNFKVSLNRTSNIDVSLSLTVAGSGKQDLDYSRLTFTNGVVYNPVNGEIIVPAGVSEFLVAISTIDDALEESEESVVLVVGGIEAVATIIDNDESVVVTDVSVLNENDAVVEGEVLDFQVSLSGTSDSDVNLSLMVEGLAEQDRDYFQLIFTNGVFYDPIAGQVTVPAGVSEFIVSIPTIDDELIEEHESVVLVVDGLEAVATIIDSDESSVVTNVSVLHANDEAIEGEILNFQVSLRDVRNSPTSLSFMVAGSAQQDVDYSPLFFTNGVAYDASIGEITVPAGVVEFMVSIPTIEDQIAEDSESVILYVGDRSATAYIIENDQNVIHDNALQTPVIETTESTDSATLRGLPDEVGETRLSADLKQLVSESNDTIPSVIERDNNTQNTNFDGNLEEEQNTDISLNVNDLLEVNLDSLDWIVMYEPPICFASPCKGTPINYDINAEFIMNTIDNNSFMEDMNTLIVID